MNILITGGNGYIARTLNKALSRDHNTTVITRQDFDLTAFNAMNNFFQGKYFDVVLHCAVQGGSRLKVDTYADMDVNLTSYYNLLQHKLHYGKFIYFGSGAEIHSPESPYGLSKRIIAKSVSEIPDFYNIRIYAVFDENELSTRFIKSSITNYLAGRSIEVYENKRMDFFYMKDLVTVVEYFINQSKCTTKLVHCTYQKSHNLYEIAQMINKLSDHKVEIRVANQEINPYIGVYDLPNIELVGLEQGIRQVYEKLKNGN